MKKMIFFFLPVFLFASDVDDILAKLLSYQQENKELHVDYNPFYKVAKESTIKTKNSPSVAKNLTLKAIMNSKAFIDSSWYGVGDIVLGYNIEKISQTEVFLKKGTNLKILELDESKKYMKVKEK